ncbi:MAG: hypothetical protein O3C40_14000 [Planctomycetota bacterium]|nr:hypothetical protein [Planctomycetota bacterium]
MTSLLRVALHDRCVRLMHYGNYGYSWEDAGMELQRYRTFHFHTK